MTKLVAMLALMTVVAGCKPPFDPVQNCNYQGARIHLQATGDCAYYGAVVQDAVDALRANDFANEEEIRHLLDRDIYIRDVYVFEDGGDQVLGVEREPSGNIELTVDASAMLHEFMHALDGFHGVSHGDSASHRYWGENGAKVVAPAYYISGHREIDGSWYNVADNSEMSWMNIYLWKLDWRSMAKPIATPTPTDALKESHEVQGEVPAAD